MLAEVGGVPLPRQIQSLAWAAEDRTLDEAVVLQETQEHAGNTQCTHA